MKYKLYLMIAVFCAGLNSGTQAMAVVGFMPPARYYDTTAGRFISPDPIVPARHDPQSLNRYAYVRDNPINLIDPTGHSWLSDATGIHINLNRFIHHNLGIDRVSFGAYAGPGGEISFTFTDNDVKIGGGIGGGVGFHSGVAFGDFDIATSQGAYASVGYDPYGGPYTSTGGGIGPVHGSVIYYPKTNDYLVAGGATAGPVGAGASYSSFGGTHLNAGAYGYGGSYGLKSGRTRYSINPRTFGGLRPRDRTQVNELKFDEKKTYGGPGKSGGIGDRLVPDFWWRRAFFRHDERFENGNGVGELHYANQEMTYDMAKRSLSIMKSHPVLIPVIAPATALLVPFYHSAVSGPGAVYYGTINAR